MAALIQSNNNTVSSATSLAVAFSSSNTAGSTIVVCCPNGTPAVTDSQGNTYAAAGSGAMFYALNAKAGANTVTLSYGSSQSWIEGYIAEFSAASSGGGIDQSAYATGTSNTPASASVTTTANGELIVGYVASNGTTISVGSGNTLVQNATGSVEEYQVQATAGAVQATFSASASATWYVFVSTFKPLIQRMALLGCGS